MSFMRTIITFLFAVFFISAVSQNFNRTNCDTLINLLPESPYWMFEFSSTWGYMGGHNGNNLNDWAEKFSGNAGTFQDIIFMPGRAHAGSPTSYITFNVHNGVSSPGAIIASKQVLINSMNVDEWNLVSFDSPVSVANDFFISFKLYNTVPQDTFVILSNSPKVFNSAWIKYPMLGWMSFQQFLAGDLNTSFAIAALFCDITNNSLVDSDRNIRVYPNPFNDEVFIKSDNSIESVKIINSIGQIVYSSKAFNSKLVNVNISFLQNGFYKVLVLSSCGKTEIQSVVKL